MSKEMSEFNKLVEEIIKNQKKIRRRKIQRPHRQNVPQSVKLTIKN